MAGWMGWFGGRGDSRESAREAIVGLRQQLLVLTKKEEFLQQKIDDELKRARANATTNKRLATAALRQKKAHENELDKMMGTRLTLETQVNTLESANLNAETMVAMRRGADALRGIHNSLNVDRVDQTMDSIREQMELSNEISEAISNPVGMGNMVDEVGLTRSHTVSQQLIQVEQDELRNELEALEQEELDDRLRGAERVPVHTPVSPVGVSSGRERVAAQAEEDDEEAQLRQLQAELAM